MKLVIKSAIAGLVAAAVLPMSALAQSYGSVSDQPYVVPAGATADRVLTDDEITQLIERSRSAGMTVSREQAEVQYVGGSQTAIETQVCCEPVEEQVTEQSVEDITETYFDAVTSREIIQPVERTIIQPVERQILRARTEDVTETVRFEQEVLPVLIREQPAPELVENVIPQETVETREELTETYFDAVTRRDVIQPIERTTVVPVQRRIVRPETETVTAPTRYEENILPTIVQEDPVPQVIETYTPQITENRVQDVTEVEIDYIAERNVYQPVERTIVQPVTRRIPQARTETITRDTIYQEDVLSTRVETDPVPQVVENVIPQVSERVVYEVEDVYIDQITRNVIQPIEITNIQPIERRILRPRAETLTDPVRYEEDVLPVIIEEARVPETIVNYIPQVTENRVEEVREEYYDVVARRDIYQPIVRTMVQPVERRILRPQTETVTAPTRYETVRGTQIIINIGTAGCNCGGF